MYCWLGSVKFWCQLSFLTVRIGLTEDEARVSRAASEKGGSGPAAAKVESARKMTRRRMVVFDEGLVM